MDTHEILDMIDHTLEDYVSPDAMRWTPETQKPPRPRVQVGDFVLLRVAQELLQEAQTRTRPQRAELVQSGNVTWAWEDVRQSYTLGAGTITTVDENTGELVQTPFVSGTVRPLR